MTSQELTFIGYAITIALAVGVPTFIYLWKRYFVGGFLTIEFKFIRGLSSPAGVLEPFIDDEGFGIRSKSIVRHHLTWKYKLIITNNSNETAFFPRISYKNELHPDIQLEEIPELKPIGGKESIEIEAIFFEVNDSLPTQRKKLEEAPVNFTTLKLLLEYYNDKDAKFYTLYNNADKSNRSFKLKPSF